jgi:TolB-like protein
MGAIVAEWCITAFVKAGRFDVVERGLINKLVEEQKLSMSGVVDDSTASRIGKLLGVEAIISGSVLKLQNVLEINARIIDVESGSIKAAENVKSTAAVRLQDLVVQMSEKIIKNFPLEGYVVSRSEQTVAIDLGRGAGAKAGMEFIVYKEGEVIRHPKTGEVLDVRQIKTGRIVLRNTLEKLSEGEILEETEPGAVAYGQMVYSASFVSEEAVAAPPPPAPFGGRGWLQVNAEPQEARVRILNIGPRYQPGIELPPGRYHIEVSASGYQTQTQWISLSAGESKQVPVSLQKAEPAAPAAQGADMGAAAVPADTPAPAADSAGSDPGISAQAHGFIRMLRSGSAEKIVQGSKMIVRARSFEPQVLDTAASVLLAGYRSNPSDRLYVDAMSWLCNVLGASGKRQYRGTLQTVARGAANRKLQKYAQKNLAALN